MQSDFQELELVESQGGGGGEPSAKRRAKKLYIHDEIWSDLSVLVVDIKNFTATCSILSAGRAGDWTQTFYDCFFRLCDVYQMMFLEKRGDCCICSSQGNVKCLLQMAVDLYYNLIKTHTLRMGVATGDMQVLLGHNFFSVGGSTVRRADSLQSQTKPGFLLMDKPSANKWSKEEYKPRLKTFILGNELLNGVVEYDLESGTFVRPRSSSLIF
jgi:hypothetical protein